MKHIFKLMLSVFIACTQMLFAQKKEKFALPGTISASGYIDANGGKMETSTDADSKLKNHLGGIKKGNSFLYNVTVKTAGSYLVDYRITSTRAVTIELLVIDKNGSETKLQQSTFPSTKGWRNWKTIHGGLVELPKGSYKLKLNVISDGFNLNWIKLSAFKGLKTPGRIYASDFISGTGGRLEDATDEKGDRYLGGIKKGNYFIYPINLSASGKFVAHYRTSGNRKARLALSVLDDLGKETVLDNMSLPSTGGWSNWKTHQGTVFQLEKGMYRLKVHVLEDGFNLNWIDILPLSAYQIPGKIKLTNYVSGSGVKYEPNSDIDAGQQLANLSTRNFFVYDVKVSAPSTYQVNLRITSRAVGKLKILASADGETYKELKTTEVYSTVGWKNWETIGLGEIQIDKSIKQIKIEVVQDGFMANWIEFLPLKK